MTDRARLAVILDHMTCLQVAHNAEVNPNWRTANLAYDRAIWIECAELLDHFGWKWWQKQAADFAQVKLELVDIWHFGLSALLRDGVASTELVDRFQAGLTSAGSAQRGDREVFCRHVETLAATALTTGGFNMGAFLDCLTWLGMDAESLYTTYVGKNVLNGFRQRHGYREGCYRKVWAGQEDNVHLVELIATLNVADDGFVKALTEALARRYAETA